MKLLIDFHIHIYSNFCINTLFNTTYQNFHTYNQESLNGQAKFYLLCLTETWKDNFFHNYEKTSENQKNISWNIEKIAPTLLKVTNNFDTNKIIYLVAGQQINTIEKLEILALNCPVKINNQLSWQETFNKIKEQQALVVINWAPGKWWFNRGKLISAILKQETNIFLGDTSLRPKKSFVHKIFKLAKDKKITVLAGSDPFPLDGEEKKCCKYFQVLEVTSNIPENNLLEIFNVYLQNKNNENVFTLNNAGSRLSFIELFKLLFKFYLKKL